MISKREAKELVERVINEPDPYWLDKPWFVVIDRITIDKDWGWVFFYDSEKHIDSGEFEDTIVGNAPYIVNSETGAIQATGTALPIEEYIAEYEAKL